MLKVLENSYKRLEIELSEQIPFEIKQLAKIINDQIEDFIKDTNPNNKMSEEYFIEQLYNTIFKKNHGSKHKVDKLFSKIYTGIKKYENLSEIIIFGKLLTCTFYGNSEMCSTYVKLRKLLFQGFKKDCNTDSLMSQFPINKKILTSICNYLKFNPDQPSEIYF